ncbi:glutamate ABC transporter substrate-binding protein [Kribbella sp. VKM Ac-2568]|uniref:glutamate ABC transporter substrate-binding protein n=1 Tax=Kribbella sp. VKM Ac-2568 TaxID=2512219 RepID=UPI001044F3B7|nr:glutamate ABC transporter substrate-binding protein [Kribbella sp. VKM Ac-2568]TCM41842.1 polar amino acid transport system substrate-binding protein [Kribbella sp. VKM Ac-2568]
MNKKSLIAGTLALLFAATACGSSAYDATPLPVKETPPAAKPAAPAVQDCTNALQSYLPDGPLPAPNAMPAGSTMAKIAAHGRLVAGVSADSLNLGSRNPLTGKIEGFDIDMINAVADAIFGTPAPGQPSKVELRVISSPQRLPVLKAERKPGAIDIVARNITINCARWKEIAFSAEYYRSGQKLLVQSDMTTVKSLDDLSGQKVCAPAGSTSLDNMIKANPKVVPVTADTDGGCLVLFQQGKVVGITGDDTVLAGEAAQDPYAKVIQAPPFSQEPYGLGMNKDQVDFVKFVNGVLAEMKADGRWQISYNKWLLPALGKAKPPAPVYGRS